MADSKELLTDILDGVTALQTFLLQELSQESLSQSNEIGRQNACKTIEGILKKIRNAHPSIRPRVNTPGGMKFTPGGMKKPAPPPPIHPPASLPEEEGELYEEAQQAEDYLSFEPAHPIDQGEEPQEMYEAMANAEEQDVYEEPVPSMGPGQGPNIDTGEPADTYDDPMTSNPSASSLPPRSQENSGSGAEYALAIRREEVPESNVEMSMDWGSVYQTMPNKGEKVKVSALKNVVIKGYLEKLGGRNHKTWQKRYCVLSGQLMYFYEKENSKTYNNCIALPTFTSSLAENMTKTSEKKFAFKLSQMDSSTGKKKDYYFRANSNDVRSKWMSSIGKALLPLTNNQGPPRTPSPNSATLPRHLPSQTTSFAPMQRQRTLSEGEQQEPEELYEDMVIPEEKEEDQDEYVAVSPTDKNPKGEMESSEEYVDVTQQQDAVDQEEYEDTTAYQPQQQQHHMPPPPPLSPPPGPPSEMFPSPPLVPPHVPPHPTQAPAPRVPPPPPPSEPEVDTSRIYEQPTTNGIRLDKVFVSLWDFVASEADELALSRGDLIYVNSPQGSAEWWFGELLESDASRKLGKAGFFPRAYSTEAFEQLSS